MSATPFVPSDRELRVRALVRVGVDRAKAEQKIDYAVIREILPPLSDDERERLTTTLGAFGEAGENVPPGSNPGDGKYQHEAGASLDPASPEAPQSVCPNCGAWVDDLDGFGVLIHDACGYCSHPDCYDDACRHCGAIV